MHGNRSGRTVMSHTPQGGQAPDQASSGRQTGAAVPPGQIIAKARNAASHPKSHKQHGDTRLATAPDRPTRQVSQSPDEPVATTAACAVVESVEPANGDACARVRVRVRVARLNAPRAG